jgi:predicted aspartyl protease
MGVFDHPLTVVSKMGDASEEVEALLDTESMYLWLPGSMLTRLGYEPALTRRFSTATGEEIERGVTPVVVRLGNETMPVVGVFGDEGSRPLMGAIVLETFGLGVDPINKRLISVPMPLFAT